MKLSARSFVIALSTIFCMNLFGANYIHDNAGFFSHDAIRKANEEIHEIQKHYKKEIFIETVKTIPTSDPTGETLESGQNLDPVFAKWAKVRLKKTGANNLYIVISKSPSYIMAAVGANTRNKGEFTEIDRNSLIHLLAESFQQHDYNRGLLESVHFVGTSIDNNLHGKPNVLQPVTVAPNTTPDVTFLWRWIGFGCAALLALLLLTGLVRGFQSSPQLKQEETPT